MKKKIIFIGLIFTAALTFFNGCHRDNRGGAGAAELRFGYTSEPATLDPLSPANTADSRSILFNVFEGLVKPGTDGRMTPAIAESWTVERNARVYNFILRDNVRFHDGAILTSADVRFSLNTAIASEFTGLEQIENIETPSDKQIVITLKDSDTEFLPYLTLGIVKDGNIDRENKIIGTGPFYIESYTIQQNLVMRKFDDYWQSSLPHLEKVTIVFFGNSDAQMLALRGGGIDGTRVTGSIASQIDKERFDLFDNYSAAVQLVALNNAAPPFNDIRVRRALNYGIDIQNIIDAAFFGMGSPSGSPVIPGLSAYYEASLSFPYEPDTARALLAQAGFDGGNRKLAFEITVPSNYTMHIDTAQVIVSQLAAIGVDASIKLVDWNTWLSDVYRDRKFQATIISVDSTVVSPRGFLFRYVSTSGGNFINFLNPTFDRVYNAALAETDETKLTGLYKEAQRVIVENAASVYIQDIYYYTVFRKGSFAGLLNYPLYVVDFASIYGIQKN